MIDQETIEAEFWRGYLACKAKPETKLFRNGKNLGYWSPVPPTPAPLRYHLVDMTV